MRTNASICHGLSAPIFIFAMLAYCGDVEKPDYSFMEDTSLLYRIERRWEGNIGGKDFAITFCEDRKISMVHRDGCVVDHVVSSSRIDKGHFNSAMTACDTCDLEIIALVDALVMTADGRTFPVAGQINLGTAYDSDLNENDFSFVCRYFESSPEIRQSLDATDVTADAGIDVPTCATLESVKLLENGALSIRGEVLRQLGYHSVNVPTLHIYPSTSAAQECNSYR